MKLKFFLMGLGIGLIISSFLFFVLQGSAKVEMSDNDIMNRAKELGMVKVEELPDKNLDKLKSEIINHSSEEKTEEVKADKETEVNEVKTNKVETTEVKPKEEKKELLTKESQEKENEKKNNSEKAPSTSTETADTTEKTDSKPESEATSNSESGQAKTAETGKKELQAANEGKKTEPENESSVPKQEKKDEPSSGTVDTKKNPKNPKQEEKKTYTYTVIPGSSAVRLCNDLQAIGLIKDAKEFNDFLAVNHYATKIRNGTFTFTSGESYKSMAEKLISRKLNP